MSRQLSVRPSPIAGTWYPGTASRLTTTVEEMMGKAAEADPPIYGLLAPHAGIRFSGPVAGKAFRYTYGLECDTVVIVSPSHHHYPASLLSSAHSHFETPLGKVPVAQDLVDTLAERVEVKRIANDPEHAIEIELPFLQRTLGQFELLPLAMLDQTWAASQKLGEALAEIVSDRNVLLVASSDLSHFYQQADAHQLDKVVMDAVAAYDPAGIIRAEEEQRGFACGRGAIAAVMVAAQQLGATNAQVVDYATSGDVTGDMTRVVGYGAALFN